MDKIIKILAAKYNLGEDVIEKIIRSQFNFVASTMQQGEFQSVHLHYFGKFGIKPNSIKRVTDMRKQYEANRDKKRQDAEQANNDI